MPPTPDPRLAPWKEVFRCGDIHPHMPPQGTLVEMEGKFDGAAGFLRSLDPGDPQQADLGVKIGTLAAHYAGAVMDAIGIGDGESVVLTANLVQARILVDNILLDVQQRIQAGWLANAADDGDQDADDDARLESVLSGTNTARAADAVTEPFAAPASGQAGQIKMGIDRDRFRVSWKGVSCDLEPGKEFLLIECLNGKPGKYYSPDELIAAVWDGDFAESNTIQKTVSNLRKRLDAAGIKGVTIEAKGRHYKLILS